jgi:hypothetical protein
MEVGAGGHSAGGAKIRGLFAVERFFAIDYRIQDEDGHPRFGIMLLKLAEDDRRKARGLFLSKKAFEDDKMGFGQVVIVRANSDLEPVFDKDPIGVSPQARPAARRATGRKKGAAKKTPVKKAIPKKKAAAKKGTAIKKASKVAKE